MGGAAGREYAPGAAQKHRGAEGRLRRDSRLQGAIPFAGSGAITAVHAHQPSTAVVIKVDSQTYRSVPNLFLLRVAPLSVITRFS